MLTIMRVFDGGFPVFLSSRLVNAYVGASAHWATLRRALVERVTRHARCVGIRSSERWREELRIRKSRNAREFNKVFRAGGLLRGK